MRSSTALATHRITAQVVTPTALAVLLSLVSASTVWAQDPASTSRPNSTPNSADMPTAKPEASATLTYNLGVVSQYRYRGLAQTKGEAALQGGLDYTHTSGLYAGAWASNVAWIADASADPSAKAKGALELDLYGGYKWEALGLAYDLGYLRYAYVGNSYAQVSGVNANTDELYAAATYGMTTLKYSYALSDLFGTPDSKGSVYWDLSATLDVGQGFGLTPHWGRQVIANSPNSYSDASLTLSKDLGDGLTLSLAALRTNAKANAYYTAAASGYNTAKGAAVLGLKYSF